MSVVISVLFYLSLIAVGISLGMILGYERFEKLQKPVEEAKNNYINALKRGLEAKDSIIEAQYEELISLQKKREVLKPEAKKRGRPAKK